MQEYKTIAKGKYAQAQSEVPVSVTNYLLFEEKGKRYLMLKLVNTRNEAVSGLRMRLTQLDGNKKTLASEEIDISVGDGEPSADFVLDKKLPVFPNCEDFKAEILSVSYGNYAYSEREGEVCVDYRKKEAKGQSTGARLRAGIKSGKTEVATKTLKAPVLVSVFAVILILAIAALTFFQLQLFKRTATEFKYEDIVYVFADGENTEDGDIIITGYEGSAKQIKIPEQLEKHKVLYVDDYAFQDNPYIEKVTFESEMSVGYGAFWNCLNLKSVNFDKITEIGDYAFAGSGITELISDNVTKVGRYAFADCQKLKKIELTNASGVDFSQGAFQRCSGLETARLDTTFNQDDLQLFGGCNGFFSLYLKEFNVRWNGSSLQDFVGSSAQIDRLEIDKLGNMPASFAEGMSIRAFQANEYNGASISEYAFKGCETLREVSFPNEITTLGVSAFAETGLESYDFSGLTYVGDYAFQGSDLQIVDVNPTESNFYMGVGVFTDCQKLHTASISYAAATLKAYTFKNCTALASVTLPTGSSLTTVETEAFYGCSTLPSVTLSTSLEELGDYAFYNCGKLQSVTLSDSLRTIGNSAFRNCVRLTNIALPTSLEFIGEYAFSDCENLTAMTIPESVITVGARAFSGCNRLAEIALGYRTNGGGGDTFYSFASLFGRVPSSLKTVIMTGTGALGSYAFQNCNDIERIILSNKTTAIGERAFAGCSALTEMRIPNSVTQMGGGILEDCSALTELSLPFVGDGTASYSSIGYTFGGAEYSSQRPPATLKKIAVTGSQPIRSLAFQNASDLERVEIAGSVGRIDENAFAYCSSLKEVVLGEGLQRIGSQAFFGCRKLTTLTLPSSLRALDSEAFAGCYNLYEICNLSSAVTPNGEYLNLCSSEAGKMPTATRDGYTFSLQNAGTAYEKWYMTAYPTVENTDETEGTHLPDYFTYNGNRVNFYALPFTLFKDTWQMTSITLPSAVKEIGRETFYNCSSLREVNFSAGSQLTEIPESAFWGCRSLKKLSLPDSIYTIGEYAFAYCEELMILRLPGNINTIADWAFEGCRKLYMVINPSGSIPLSQGSSAYGGVAANALFLNPAAQWQRVITQNGVDYLTNGRTWYVIGFNAENAGGSIDLTLDRFSYNYTLASDIRILPNAFNYTALSTLTLGSAVTEIGENAFARNGNLTSVEMNNCGVNVLPYGVFSGCASLATVSFPNGLEIIESNAFSGCNALEAINLPTTLTEIGEYAFQSAYTLKELTLPEGLRRVGDYAFSQCSELRTVTLPTTLETIGDYAFLGCSYLHEVYDLSPYLTVEAGSSANGWVGSYALAVYTSKTEARRVLENTDGLYVKIGSEWTLYKWAHYANTVRLPESVDCYGTRVTSYALGENAFSVCRGSAVILPKSVTKVASNALNTMTVYFAGTENEWKQINGYTQAGQSQIYYKVDCVHGSEQWTYDGYQNPITYVYTASRDVETATCQKTGKTQIFCTVCGEVLETVEVPLAAHSVTAEGSCAVCGATGTVATAENYLDLGFVNDGRYAYAFEGGVLVSSNKQNSTSSTLTFTAQRQVEVVLSIAVSSESGYDKFTLSLNGAQRYQISGTERVENITFTLSAGETLTFVYSKDGSQSSGQDRGSITQFVLFELESVEV